MQERNDTIKLYYWRHRDYQDSDLFDMKELNWNNMMKCKHRIGREENPNNPIHDRREKPKVFHVAMNSAMSTLGRCHNTRYNEKDNTEWFGRVANIADELK